MKNRNKILLYVLSLLMVSLISFNASFINAESNKTIINFINEDGNPLDIEDTVSIVKLEDQGGAKVPVSVYIKDGKETTDYNKGTPLNELEIIDGKLEIDGLTKDDEYLISFDNDYVFKKEDDEKVNYFLFGSFKGEKETYINSSDIKSVDELTFEQLEEISGNKEIMDLGTGWIRFTSGCNYYNGSVTARAIDSGVTCSGDRCETSTTAGQGSYRIRLTCNGKTTVYTWNTSPSSKPLSCSECNIPDNAECTPGTSGGTYTCEAKKTATQYYDANGGVCPGASSNTRTKDATTKTKSCNSNYRWTYSSCTTTYWSGSVSAPSCTKGDTTDYATVYYNGNKGNGSSEVTVNKKEQSTSRTTRYTFTGFSNYSETFTSDTTAYAQYSSSTGSWSSVTLPTTSEVYRQGYTLTGWSDNGSTYSPGQTVTPNGETTYNAIWQANDTTYTIRFKSSSGIILDERQETHKYDETVTITHSAIPGYTVSDKQVRWNPNATVDGSVIEITYQLITYNIEYSLEIGNRYPNGNATKNPNASTTTYNVESDPITFSNPTRTGYTFIGWFTEEGFINEKPTIPSGSVGDVKVYAKFEANSYPLTVTNTNDRVSVTGTINGEAYTLAPKQSITKNCIDAMH